MATASEPLAYSGLPWDRLPGETDRAYQAFVAYRDLGPRRSIDKLCAELYGTRQSGARPARSHVRDWSRAHRWVERARAWDAEQERLDREAQADARRDMARRHADDALRFQAKALAALKGIDPAALSPADVVRFYSEAVKIERLARGEPDTIREQRGPVEVDGSARLERLERAAAILMHLRLKLEARTAVVTLPTMETAAAT